MWSAMPKQMSTLNQRDTERMNADRAELAARMMLVLSGEGTLEGQPGLNFSRFSQPTELHHGFYEPCLCVIAQGAKTLTLGNEVFRYDPANYMIATIGVPMTAQVVEASPERPYLGVRLVLDPAIVSSVMVEAGIVQSLGDGDVKAVNVRTLDAELLDSMLRLVRLIDRPSDYRMLAPLIIREIVYRLLIGPESSRMRHLAAFGGLAHSQ